MFWKKLKRNKCFTDDVEAGALSSEPPACDEYRFYSLISLKRFL